MATNNTVQCRRFVAMAPSTRKRKQRHQQPTKSPIDPPPPNVPESEAHDDGVDDLEKYVDQILKDHGLAIEDDDGSSSTITRSGWCLKEGLIHIIRADNCTTGSSNNTGVGNMKMKQIIKQHGPPKIFTSIMSTSSSSSRNGTHQCRHDVDTGNNPCIGMTNSNDQAQNSDDDDEEEEEKDRSQQPKNCFQSLCRIIAGQQLAGSAARAMWHRLLHVTNNDLSPEVILSLVASPKINSDGSSKTSKGMDIESLRKPAGLSNAKAKSIVALAEAFVSGKLSEEFLTSSSSSSNNNNNNNKTSKENDGDEQDKIIRDTLLGIKGIGPWSCDMFLMFYLEKPNVLPIGDLGVRKGMQRYCASLRRGGKGKRGSLCQKQDLQRILTAAKPYQPYQSIFSYYMWKVADTPDLYGNNSRDNESSIARATTGAIVAETKVTANTPKTKKAKAVARQVTP